MTRARPGKKPGKGSKGGRPRLEIDAELVAQLAKINCTYEEIAAVVGCSVDTLERRFAEPIKDAREEGRASLRRAQWKNALAGNHVMQIWLGKNELGQKDVVETTAKVEVTEVRWRVVDPPGKNA